MNQQESTPRDPKARKDENSYDVEPDMTPRREGGDDAIAESSPIDSRLDEKVIVNEQRSNKTVNTPSQNAAHTSEGESSDDEILDWTV